MYSYRYSSSVLNYYRYFTEVWKSSKYDAVFSSTNTESMGSLCGLNNNFEFIYNKDIAKFDFHFIKDLDTTSYLAYDMMDNKFSNDNEYNWVSSYLSDYKDDGMKNNFYLFSWYIFEITFYYEKEADDSFPTRRFRSGNKRFINMFSNVVYDYDQTFSGMYLSDFKYFDIEKIIEKNGFKNMIDKGLLVPIPYFKGNQKPLYFKNKLR